MRKALLIGINDYPGKYKLHGCINDVNALEPLLKRDGYGNKLFDVKKLLDVQSGKEVLAKIEELFRGDGEMALLYYSGHGYSSEIGTEIVMPDDITNTSAYYGLQMRDIMDIVNKSKFRNKVIILDCCHSGDMGSINKESDLSGLYPGVTILSACRENESAMEKDNQGVFTMQLCNALDGGAAAVDGTITLGSIYTYIDRMFGSWEQRPIFKTNVSSFVPFRKVEPKVPLVVIRKIATYFPTADSEYKLDPSYEYTNSPEYSEYYKNREPLASDAHVEIFQELQKMQSVGLVEPINADYMYWAAIKSKSCRLTALGKHYWRMVKFDKI